MNNIVIVDSGKSDQNKTLHWFACVGEFDDYSNNSVNFQDDEGKICNNISIFEVFYFDIFVIL